ncbi:MAG TPA: NADP-dependent oxidoreductase [Pseudonocardiaceae bacterium]
MRAVVLREFGGPEVLSVEELPTPPTGPDMVLVRAEAAAVNPVDWKIRRGYLTGAYPHHFPLVPGWDVAGVVEAVGPAVTEFAPGDPVLGYVRRDEVQHGTYAELVPAPIRTLARRPEGLDAVTAAAVPLAGLTAHQALDAIGVGEGDTVLVHSAAGGVGSFAVQLARLRGARVIGTCGERNDDYLRELGVEPVRYGEGLAARVRELAPEGVDAVVDLRGPDALATTPEVLRTPGRVVSIVDAGAVKELGGRYVFVRPNPEQLAELARLVADGKLRVEISERFPLERAADAHRRSEEGHVRGKIVIEIA